MRSRQVVFEECGHTAAIHRNGKGVQLIARSDLVPAVDQRQTVGCSFCLGLAVDPGLVPGKLQQPVAQDLLHHRLHDILKIRLALHRRFLFSSVGQMTIVHRTLYINRALSGCSDPADKVAQI